MHYKKIEKKYRIEGYLQKQYEKQSNFQKYKHGIKFIINNGGIRGLIKYHYALIYFWLIKKKIIK